MNTRPDLKTALYPELFTKHYWLHAELADFCRRNKLSVQGSKHDLAKRVEALLSGKPVPPNPGRRARGTMPEVFTRETPIGPGWRCSESLRAFISAEIGKPFRFDRYMREQIASGRGARLGEVIDAWRIQEGRVHEIEPQFEYNRFTREYRKHFPASTRSEVIDAWKRYRALPSSQRPPVHTLGKG